MEERKLFRVSINHEIEDTFTIIAENIYEALEQSVKVLRLHPSVIKKIEEIK